MTLPNKLQQKINYILYNTRNDIDHNIQPVERLDLYRTFGVSNHPNNALNIKQLAKGEHITIELSIADKTLGFLSTLTARKILPIWVDSEAAQYIIEDEDYSNSPIEMIQTAESVIFNRIEHRKAYADLCGKYYNGLGGLEFTVNEKIYSVAATAYSCLEVTLCGINGLRFSSNKKLNYTDEEVTYGQRDFAAFAVRAYISIDNNEPGLWRLKKPDSEIYKPLLVNPQKRLEFWEWWLTEAIPQAWELAQSSYQDKEKNQE